MFVRATRLLSQTGTRDRDSTRHDADRRDTKVDARGVAGIAGVDDLQ